VARLRPLLIAYLSSRILVFAILSVGSQLQFVQKVESNTLWETRIHFQFARMAPELERLAMIGDAWWYRWIAVEGYQHRPFVREASNWAFFPLYPLAVRSLAATGRFALDAMIVSNIAFLLALLVVRDIAIRYGLDAAATDRAIFLLAFFPTAYFFSLPMSESLFLLLSATTFNAAQREKWWLAGMAGALTTLTRVTGVLLLPMLAVWIFERRLKPRISMLSLLAMPAALAGFMLYLRALTGNAFAFSDVQAGWGRHPSWFVRPLWSYLANPLLLGERWNLIAFNFVIAILVLAAGIVFLIKREWSFATYVLSAALLALSSGSLQSFARYASVLFPLFLLLGRATRKSELANALLAISATLLGVFVALFVLRVDIALA